VETASNLFQLTFKALEERRRSMTDGKSFTLMSHKNDLFKKRSFVSPQKAQASIKAFTSNKPPSKKANSNKSPHHLSSPLSLPLPASPPSVKGRSAPSSRLSRSFLAIVPAQKGTPRTEPDKSRNFFDLIAQDKDEDLNFSKVREDPDYFDCQDQELEEQSKGIVNPNHQDSPKQQEGIRTPNLEQEEQNQVKVSSSNMAEEPPLTLIRTPNLEQEEQNQVKVSSSNMAEEPPLTLKEKIAIARALLSDASVLAEMNEVLEDKEKVEMLRHISTPSNKEQSDLPNGHIQGTDEPSVTKPSEDVVMEE